ncbi:Pre-rRNA-processing protein TSR2 [Amphibalanus amphitrite]|uniref:Pre-rRNA-processing protein TSR2 homolog n=1 Tax=Amphibalanus amphitrite TaxID=1232801 RepID=A0A6A4VV67_AMPAM|nr:pre-rRNA-processing protein TSR2 homolog [Amphibalanus amphitrite]XP_043207963.1 pre-rRNA-processing protein TSR2 homolog [Amphibalanus amphitrite]XP_043207964.1 pre-rRNA-processing protein TSR2 homolog [Amphibalanus amphitrite]XP_043207965.1 pre-rRNA-processing protein TSR2 homolog [Amphibalanus amphitrite]XP_043207967.1 pre-rRNA-processing protein TSR2 homolog [Amphibalanus amphitrite]XP_043207968.1 pre-rRNA-processing protein TSR2 homolog [Amphibalanus amphitrite]KAF0299937.1 Pre-rRNA-p
MASGSARHPVFRECVERHFKTWSSLQLALREVMPGPIGLEFFSWLIDSTETFFYENADLYPDEVTDFLAEILNTELDTWIQDGSLELVCGALCSGFRACAAGRAEEVTAELAKLPAPADLSGHRQAPAVNPDDDDESPAAPVTPGPSRPAARDPPQSESMQTDEDGWTVARKRR